MKVLRADDRRRRDRRRARARSARACRSATRRFAFKADERETDAEFDLPVEIRNDIARLEIAGERSAGAVQLLDKRWRRRTVGVVSGATADTAQPLLASTYYLARALSPFADVRLAERGSPAEAVTPVHRAAPADDDPGRCRQCRRRGARPARRSWIEDGGVLVRFAGPRLAAGDDDLVPVKLRRGGRILGGSLTWDQPQPLAAFSREGPFAGMPVPNDVTVTRQVLAEPDADARRAHLGDARRRHAAGHRAAARQGPDRAVPRHRRHALVRPAAVRRLRRHAQAHRRPVGHDRAPTKPPPAAARRARWCRRRRVLDGFGAFGPPPPTARPVPAGFAGRATADHPPGFYGPPEGLLAVNTLAPADRLAPLDLSRARAPASRPIGWASRRICADRSCSPRWRCCALDALVVFWLAGGIARLIAPRAAPRRPHARRWRSAIARRARCCASPRSLRAGLADASRRSFAHASRRCETRLAYVVTGDAEVDAISKRRPAGPDAVPGAAHRARSRRADRARSSRATNSPSFR